MVQRAAPAVIRKAGLVPLITTQTQDPFRRYAHPKILQKGVARHHVHIHYVPTVLIVLEAHVVNPRGQVEPPIVEVQRRIRTPLMRCHIPTITHKVAVREGVITPFYIEDNDDDHELRIAFDFDGVLASDESERIYKQAENIGEYFQHEQRHATEALPLGPLGPLLQKISLFQRLENEKFKEDGSYQKIIKTSIVTARNSPAHERVVTSLNEWGVEVDDAFFLGGIDKSRILNILQPHLFFDDQKVHLEHIDRIPAVHIPFGIANS